VIARGLIRTGRRDVLRVQADNERFAARRNQALADIDVRRATVPEVERAVSNMARIAGGEKWEGLAWKAQNRIVRDPLFGDQRDVDRVLAEIARGESKRVHPSVGEL
jgi:hypothetical protein